MQNSADSIVRYRLPHHDTVVSLTGRAQVIVPQSGRAVNGFIIAPFEGDAVLITEVDSHTAVPFSYLPPQKTYQDSYPTHFRLFRDALCEGRFHKLVLAHPFPTGDIEAETLFQRLLASYPTAFVYLLSSPLTGTWVGASPEMLLQTEGNEGRTVALAATTPIGGEWDEKCKEEQAIVADYVASTLTAQGLSFDESPAHTIVTGRLQHLCTDFRFPTNNVTPLTLARALHPTPAVCGLPKSEAQQFILQSEGFNRRFYAGFLGPVSKNETHLFVNIRCAELHANNIATIFAGGGLLPASCMEDEWEELKQKRDNVIR